MFVLVAPVVGCSAELAEVDRRRGERSSQHFRRMTDRRSVLLADRVPASLTVAVVETEFLSGSESDLGSGLSGFRRRGHGYSVSDRSRTV